MLELAQQLQNYEMTASRPLRITTNGLVPNPTTIDTAKLLKSSGIEHVSVALMTSNKDQYNELMSPLVPDAHARVCQFIQRAVEVGFY